jgi:hypothetical protein
MHLPTGERSPHIFASGRTALLSAHCPTQYKRASAAVYHHDIDDLVVLFGQTIGVAVKNWSNFSISAV